MIIDMLTRYTFSMTNEQKELAYLLIQNAVTYLNRLAFWSEYDYPYSYDADTPPPPPMNTPYASSEILSGMSGDDPDHFFMVYPGE